MALDKPLGSSFVLFYSGDAALYRVQMCKYLSDQKYGNIPKELVVNYIPKLQQYFIGSLIYIIDIKINSQRIFTFF